MVDKAFDVVVVGNIGVDTNVYLPGEDVDLSIETDFAQTVDCVGQAGGYASRGFARLGKKTAFIGYVGDDYNGKYVLDSLAHDQINTSAVFIDPAGTSRNVSLVASDGQRRSFYDGKSHLSLQPDLDLCRAIIEQSRLVHFNLPNWARELLPIAAEAGATISCDIQDVTSFDDPYRQAFIQYADVLFFSAVNIMPTPDKLAILLSHKPNQVIVAGMGERGCALGMQSILRYYEAINVPDPVVDTNGAGDGLAVGFLSSFVLDGYDEDDSIVRGQIAARYTCSLRGATDKLISMNQLNTLFSRLKK